MTTEAWKDIPGFEKRYEVSDKGRIRNIRTGRVLVQTKSSPQQPYPQVPLGRGKNGWVHRLVAWAFLGPQPKGVYVLHKNDDPADNRLENLRYGTNVENKEDRNENNLFDFSKRYLDADRIADLCRAGFGSRRIAKWLGYNRQTVATFLQRIKAV